MYKPTEGQVTFAGTVLPPKPGAVVRAGMARTFQNIRLFANMTALENVMVGRYCRTGSAAFTSIIRGPKFRREEADSRERAEALLEFVGLSRVSEHLARNLAYGDQRRLEIARALATDPKLILLDEPTAGMNPQETRQASDLIFRIRDRGLAVVVIEHDMRFIFGLCDRVLCLVRGATLVEGTPQEVQSDPRVIEAYIGTGDEDDEESGRGRARSPDAESDPQRRRAGGGSVSAMLEVEDLRVAYGKIEAVKGISFSVDEGQVVCLIGTNGAGKTTTLRTISGLLRPSKGRISFQGKRIDNVAPHDIVSSGLAHSPEGRRIFPA